ncbi:MAG: kelch repeat-containing protein [Sphingobacterium sp.]
MLLIPRLSQSQGLKFRGGHEPIDKRSSYELFDKRAISFEQEFTLKFQLSIYSSNSLGNIFRVKNKDNNTVYNLFYDEEAGNCIFRLNEEGKSSLIIAKINQQQLFKEEWITIQLTFDLQKQLFKLQIQNQIFQSPKVKLPSQYSPQVIFGKSDYLIDVPAMSIKNVQIGNTAKSYLFPLKESTGTVVHDENGIAYGSATNPTWLIVDSYKWKNLFASGSFSQAGSNYNQRTKEIYYFNQDSITIYNIKTNQTKKRVFQKPCPVKLVLANNFIDATTNKLYVYELFYTQPYQGPTVASLDLETFEWKVESEDLMKKELNHHGSFYDEQQRQFYIFGGYGNMAYSGQFDRYDLDSGKWQTVDGWTGDKIFPRYFLSAGQGSNNRIAYIFGGMGNESGEHIVGRKYLYDFYQINLDTKEITKKWDVLWKDKHIVPARGLVFPDSNHFYALCYPEYLTKSNIQLYRFSIKDGSFDILGDSVPIYSDKISTHAQLYYDQQLGRLLVLVQESKDDIQST